MDFNKGKELIGLIVRNKRDKLKLTQENVCEKANLDVSNYSKMETGRVTPSLSSLYKIIKCAGFVPNEIFECEHLLEEKELDTVVINEYTSLSLKKKQTLYRIMQILKEFE